MPQDVDSLLLDEGGGMAHLLRGTPCVVGPRRMRDRRWLSSLEDVLAQDSPHAGFFAGDRGSLQALQRRRDQRSGVEGIDECLRDPGSTHRYLDELARSGG